MFINNQDLYNFVVVLIEKLREEDKQEWSNKFHEALFISGMPGEILGKLRLVFRIFTRTSIPIDLHMEKEVKEALIYLNKALSAFRIFD